MILDIILDEANALGTIRSVIMKELLLETPLYDYGLYMECKICDSGRILLRIYEGLEIEVYCEHCGYTCGQ
jgi:hypothetical protein